jgi:hypothetical protein
MLWARPKELCFLWRLSDVEWVKEFGCGYGRGKLMEDEEVGGYVFQFWSGDLTGWQECGNLAFVGLFR